MVVSVLHRFRTFPSRFPEGVALFVSSSQFHGSTIFASHLRRVRERMKIKGGGANGGSSQRAPGALAQLLGLGASSKVRGACSYHHVPIAHYLSVHPKPY